MVIEAGDAVRITAGKHRGLIGTVKACSGEDGFVIDLGGGRLKIFRKESLSPVVRLWSKLRMKAAV